MTMVSVGDSSCRGMHKRKTLLGYGNVFFMCSSSISLLFPSSYSLSCAWVCVCVCACLHSCVCFVFMSTVICATLGRHTCFFAHSNVFALVVQTGCCNQVTREHACVYMYVRMTDLLCLCMSVYVSMRVCLKVCIHVYTCYAILGLFSPTYMFQSRHPHGPSVLSSHSSVTVAYAYI